MTVSEVSATSDSGSRDRQHLPRGRRLRPEVMRHVPSAARRPADSAGRLRHPGHAPGLRPARRRARHSCSSTRCPAGARPAPSTSSRPTTKACTAAAGLDAHAMDPAAVFASLQRARRHPPRHGRRSAARPTNVDEEASGCLDAASPPPSPRRCGTRGRRRPGCSQPVEGGREPCAWGIPGQVIEMVRGLRRPAGTRRRCRRAPQGQRRHAARGDLRARRLGDHPHGLRRREDRQGGCRRGDGRPGTDGQRPRSEASP